jgi:hypothetical protein
VVKVIVDYDHVPGDDEPTEVDLGYDELPREMVVGLAMSGDHGAIDYLSQR